MMSAEKLASEVCKCVAAVEAVNSATQSELPECAREIAVAGFFAVVKSLVDEYVKTENDQSPETLLNRVIEVLNSSKWDEKVCEVRNYREAHNWCIAQALHAAKGDRT